MRRSRYIGELEYKAYLEELRQGKEVGKAINDAWEKGAPKVFMEYEMLRRHISSRYKHGDYYSVERKALREFLDVIYEWWLTHRPAYRPQFICLLERMEQPAPWPWGIDVFRSHIYAYIRGSHK